MHYLPCPIQILKYSATLNSDIFYEFWEWKKKQIIDDYYEVLWKDWNLIVLIISSRDSKIQQYDFDCGRWRWQELDGWPLLAEGGER